MISCPFVEMPASPFVQFGGMATFDPFRSFAQRQILPVAVIKALPSSPSARVAGLLS